MSMQCLPSVNHGRLLLAILTGAVLRTVIRLTIT